MVLDNNRIKRGEIDETDLLEYKDCNLDELLVLLKSNIPQKRTIASKLLSEYNNVVIVDALIEALKKEKALYSKIEITKTLVKLNSISIKPLIIELGKIGNNQEKALPKKYFKKKSFPLCRDIVARTLVSIGPDSIDELLFVLKDPSKSMFIKQQAIDALAAITYKYHEYDIIINILEFYEEIEVDDIVSIWKVLRALSAFYHNNGALNLAINIFNKYKNHIPIIFEFLRTVGKIGICNNEVMSILDNISISNSEVNLALDITKNELCIK